MSTALAIREPNQVLLTSDQLSYIASTEFVPPGLRGNLPAILACVAMGRELGIGDMVALKSIHIIDGKATFSAELMVQLVRKRGHSITGDVGPAQATVMGTRADNGDTMTATWTLDMADRAGLLGKSNWKKYPEAMLWARAASQLCRMLFADCFAGNTYTPEELEDSSSEPREGAPSSQPQTPHDAAASLDEQATGERVGGDDPAPPAADVPFGDDYDAPILPAGSHKDKPPTAAMLKKLNVLVGKLREAGHLTTLQLYQSMGHDPHSKQWKSAAFDADGDLHWSPLRDSLTFSEAMQLIDRLEKYAADKPGQST